MAKPIIAALRQRKGLKESVKHTLQELAHLTSIYGVARTSYDYLATKSDCSRRTAIRHIQIGIDAKIIRKKVVWLKGNYCEVNTYTFVIPWDIRPATGGSDKTASTLPQKEREKERSVQEDLERQKKGIQFLAPGTERWDAVQREIARLEALLVGTGDRP